MKRKNSTRGNMSQLGNSERRFEHRWKSTRFPQIVDKKMRPLQTPENIIKSNYKHLLIQRCINIAGFHAFSYYSSSSLPSVNIAAAAAAKK